MRQYEVYRNPSLRLRAAIPYVVILQSDAVPNTTAVIAAGLARQVTTKSSRLYPSFEVDGISYMLLTPDLASIPREVLTERAASHSSEWNRITAALDLLFTGI